MVSAAMLTALHGSVHGMENESETKSTFSSAARAACFGGKAVRALGGTYLALDLIKYVPGWVKDDYNHIAHLPPRIKMNYGATNRATADSKWMARGKMAGKVLLGGKKKWQNVLVHAAILAVGDLMVLATNSKDSWLYKGYSFVKGFFSKKSTDVAQ